MHTTAATVLDGLTFVVGSSFPDAQIFADRGPQGVEPGTFFVRQIGGVPHRRLGLLYNPGGTTRSRLVQTDATFEITYHPAADVGNGEDECRAVQEELFELLEVVPTTDKALVRGEDISGSISDGVLVVTVRFQYSTLWIPEDNFFGRLIYTLRGVHKNGSKRNSGKARP